LEKELIPKRKKVAVLIEAVRGHERALLRGIGKYARMQGRWVFYLNKLDPFYRRGKFKDDVLVSRLLKWGVDGIITRYPGHIESFSKIGIPVVSAIQEEFEQDDYNIIEINNKAVGIMAAEHFMARGFRHYGFCGLNEMFWSNRRFESFARRLNEVGYDVSHYEQSRPLKYLSWDIELAAITKWLEQLPKPVAILVCNDDRAEHIIEGCKQAGLNIPEDVAVLGVDNDEFICEFSDPPLSSVVLNSEKGGYEAAELLDMYMNGHAGLKKKIVIDPTNIAERQSTDILAIEDRDVARAMAFIRSNSDRIIQAEDVADYVGLSLRVLQKRFHKVKGRSLREEFKRVRLAEITKLLRETRLTVSQIALSLGYSNDHNLARFFSKEEGISPSEYRKKYSKVVVDVEE
jgi:LacI family transcriptional regulator